MENSSNDNNDTNLTFKQTLFKQNYKFINFQKSSDCSKTSTETSESIKTFYQELIQTSQSDYKSESDDDVIILEERIESRPKIDPKDFLKAAQNNDLKTIIDYFQRGFDLLVLDDYKWNVLMIAISSFNNQIVKFLLENIQNKDLVNKLLSQKDSSGNTAELLAQKFKNTEAIEMIQELSKEKSQDVDEESFEEVIENSEFYCESCKKNFNTKDESHYEHITSIVHQINENSSDTEKQKKILVNYHLRGNNKGYQLMLKSGWNERGLGVLEQGRTMPIKTQQKLDRLGIGVEKTSKVYTRPIKNVKLKSSKSDSGLMKTVINLRDTIKTNEKLKNYEREMRRYFDT